MKGKIVREDVSFRVRAMNRCPRGENGKGLHEEVNEDAECVE